MCSCGSRLVVPQLPESLQQLLLTQLTPKGTPDHIVESLPVISYEATQAQAKSTDGDNNNCSTCIICMDDYEQGNELSMLPCFHKFHKDCIKEWLSGSKSCPICKGSIIEMMSQSQQFATDDV
jgi:hypothetical protein